MPKRTPSASTPLPSPRMQPGISSYTYPWAIGLPGHPPAKPMTALDLIQEAVRLNVEVVQLADNLPASTWNERNLEVLADAARKASIVLEVGIRGVTPDALLLGLDRADRLGARLLRTLLDGPHHHPHAHPDLATAIGYLRDLLPELDRRELQLGIENHDLRPAGELCALMDELDHPLVGIVLDTVNSLGALESPRETIEALAPHTINLHVKDFTISRVPSMMGFTVTGAPAGQGRLDFDHLQHVLQEKDRKPSAILELWTPMQADLTATIELERSWAAQSITFLKQWTQAASSSGSELEKRQSESATGGKPIWKP